MKCDDCGKREANVHLTQITQGETRIFHLCETCARHKGISITLEPETTAASPQNSGEPDLTCPACKLSLSEFRARGRLGCGRCYDAFEEEIDDLLMQVHGAKVHRGKACVAFSGPRHCPADLDQLKGQLNRAIKNEEFELAAAIRDAINSVVVKNRKIASEIEGA